jgi:hypothetical protein
MGRVPRRGALGWTGTRLLSATAVVALLGFAARPREVAGQGRRLSVLEAGGGVAVVAARSTFSGVELWVARRAGAGLPRLTLGAAGGAYARRVGTRVAATAQFLLRPVAKSGASPYGGVGVAFAGAVGVPGTAYLMLVLGVESAPGRPQGWYAEGGLAGGVRAAAGWRWRRFPAWW